MKKRPKKQKKLSKNRIIDKAYIVKRHAIGAFLLWFHPKALLHRSVDGAAGDHGDLCTVFRPKRCFDAKTGFRKKIEKKVSKVLHESKKSLPLHRFSNETLIR